MAFDAGAIKGRIVLDTAHWHKSASTVKKDAQALTKRLDNIGRAAERVGKKLLLMGTAASAAFGLAVKKAASVEEAENLFEVSMGNMADSTREWSESLQQAVGVNAATLREGVGTFNAMFKSMGFAEEGAANMGIALTQLSGDLASFYNISDDEALLKLRAGIVGEAEPLKRLGILVDENTVKQVAWRKGIAEVGKELTQQQKVQGRMAAILEQTTLAQGDLARTMDSTQNMMRRSSVAVEILTVAIGDALIPAVKSMLGWFLAATSALMSFADVNNDTFTKVVRMAAAFSLLSVGIGGLGVTLPPLVRSFAAVAKGLGITKLALGGLVGIAVTVAGAWRELRYAVLWFTEGLIRDMAWITGKFPAVVVEFKLSMNVLKEIFWQGGLDIQRAWDKIKSLFGYKVDTTGADLIRQRIREIQMETRDLLSGKGPGGKGGELTDSLLELADGLQAIRQQALDDGTAGLFGNKDGADDGGDDLLARTIDLAVQMEEIFNKALNFQPTIDENADAIELQKWEEKGREIALALVPADAIVQQVSDAMKALSAAGQMDDKMGNLLGAQVWEDMRDLSLPVIEEIIARLSEMNENAAGVAGAIKDAQDTEAQSLAEGMVKGLTPGLIAIEEMELKLTAMISAGVLTGEAGNVLAEDTWNQMGNASAKNIAKFRAALKAAGLEKKFKELSKEAKNFVREAKANQVADTFDALAGVVGGKLGKAFEAASFASKLAGKIMNFAAYNSLGPWGYVLLAIEAVVEVFGIFSGEQEKVVKGISKVFDEIGERMDDWASNLTDALITFLETGKFEIKEFADQILRDILRISLTELVTAPLLSALGPLGTAISAVGLSSLVNLGGGGQQKSVNIYDQREPGAPAAVVSKSIGPDGSEVVDVIIAATKAGLAAGDFDNDFQQHFGVNRAAHG